MSTNKPANKEPDIKLFREKDDSERITKLKKGLPDVCVSSVVIH